MYYSCKQRLLVGRQIKHLQQYATRHNVLRQLIYTASNKATFQLIRVMSLKLVSLDPIIQIISDALSLQ